MLSSTGHAVKYRVVVYDVDNLTFKLLLDFVKLVDFNTNQNEVLKMLVMVVNGMMVQNRTLMKVLHLVLLKVGNT